MSSSSEHLTRPEFKVISVEEGQEFLKQVVDYCIVRYPDLVDLVFRGRIPKDMLEYHPTGVKGLNMGRKAGTYTRNANIITVDQSVLEYREELITTTIASDLALSKAEIPTARTGALAILFPEVSKVSREKFRAHLESSTRALLQLLSLSWPSTDIQTRMAIDTELNDAYDRQDLIAWVRAFNKFCLNSSGNKQINCQRAEKAIELLKMRGIELPKYVKDFNKAAENLRSVESQWSELRIVTTFIKGLNQSESVFNHISRDFANKHSPVFVLQSSKLSSAVTWVEDHFREVIAPQLAEKREETIQLNNAKDVVAKVGQIGKRGGSSNSDVAKVSFAVLATIVSDKRKAEDQLAVALKRVKQAETSKLAKAKVDLAKPNAANVDKPKPKVVFKSNAKCHKHLSQEGCSYGDSCKFSHTA